jgi:hypothetical protein
MELLEKHWPKILGVIGVVAPALGWIGNSIYDGAVYKGELKAKQEINETYNEALRDAIIYRAKYESCCSDLREDQP